MVSIQERLENSAIEIQVAKRNLEEALNQLISELTGARSWLREAMDDPEVAGVSIVGIVMGRGAKIDRLTGEIEMGTRQYTRMKRIVNSAGEETSGDHKNGG